MQPLRKSNKNDTVDGRTPAPADIVNIKYPIIYRVLYIPGGAGFLPPTVPWEKREGLNHPSKYGVSCPKTMKKAG